MKTAEMITYATMWNDHKGKYWVQFTGGHGKAYEIVFNTIIENLVNSFELAGYSYDEISGVYQCPCGLILHALGIIGFEMVYGRSKETLVQQKGDTKQVNGRDDFQAYGLISDIQALMNFGSSIETPPWQK